MEKQLSIFEKKNKASEQKNSSKEHINHTAKAPFFTIFIDGASRGNPGPAGAGIYICYEKKPIISQGFFLGTKTNNQAEYLALVLSILLIKEYCLQNKIKTYHLSITSDSELLIKQMKGIYKVKNADLQGLKNISITLLEKIPHGFFHTLREFNKDADRLANQGIDKKQKIPTGFLKIMADCGLLLLKSI